MPITRMTLKMLFPAATLMFVALTAPAAAQEGDVSEPRSPGHEVIRLFNGSDLSNLVTWLSDTKYEDPRNVFSVQDGMLHISGDGGGYIRTKEAYRDYHLVIEFRWGERTWGGRENCARDSGIIVHCVGPDGGYGNVFMAGFEAQMIEGGTGDFIIVPGNQSDGTPIPISLSAEVTTDRDGEAVWQKGGATRTFTSGRVNWYGRDVDWADTRGFRGREDVESPFGEWTRMDVICDQGRIVILVNGVVVNAGFDASHCAGQILLQSEFAEVVVRRWELWPIGQAPAYEPFKTVVVPVGPDNPRNSEAAIIPLQDGTLLLGWTEFYAGDGADHGPARISGKVSRDGGWTWGDKYTLVENDGGCNVMEVNFLRLTDGRIALFYCQKNTESSDCRVMMRVSSDEGRTFGAPQQLSADGKYTGLTNGRSIRLASGRILLEAWENGDSYCYLSDDDGQTWRESQRVNPGHGSWEPACIELGDGRVLMLMRTGDGGQFQSYSADGGETWSDPVLSQLVGTAAPVSISRVPITGDLLAIWNHNPDTADAQNRNRTPLTAAISRDAGTTWENFRNIEEAPGDAWAYPAVTWVGQQAFLTYFNYQGGHSLQLKILPADWFYGGHGASLGAVLDLFNGRNLDGWRVKGDAGGYWQVGTASLAPDDPRELVVDPAGNELINAQRGGHDLYSELEFGDAVVEVEVMVPRGSNSGIYIMGEYEIQIYDSFGRETLTQGDMGAIYSAAAPSVQACRAPGEWQSFRIRYRAPRFDAAGNKTAPACLEEVVLNGVVIQKDVEVQGPTGGSLRNREAPRGPLMFQGDHGPVAYRHIRVRPLN